MDIPIQDKMIKMFLETKEELTKQIIAVDKLIQLHYRRESMSCKNCSDKNITIFFCFRCNKIVEKMCNCPSMNEPYQEYNYNDQMFFICNDCCDSLKNNIQLS